MSKNTKTLDINYHSGLNKKVKVELEEKQLKKEAQLKSEAKLEKKISQQKNIVISFLFFMRQF